MLWGASCSSQTARHGFDKKGEGGAHEMELIWNIPQEEHNKNLMFGNSTITMDHKVAIRGQVPCLLAGLPKGSVGHSRKTHKSISGVPMSMEI